MSFLKVGSSAPLISCRDQTTELYKRSDHWSLQEIRPLISTRDQTTDLYKRSDHWSLQEIRPLISTRDQTTDLKRSDHWSLQEIRSLISCRDQWSAPNAMLEASNNFRQTAFHRIGRIDKCMTETQRCHCQNSWFYGMPSDGNFSLL